MLVISIGLISILGLSMVLLFFALFCMSGYGPEISQLYKKHTIIQSLFGPRPLRSQEYLIQLVMGDPVLYKIAKGPDQKKELECKKKKVKTRHHRRLSSHLETQMTNRALLNDFVVTDMTPPDRDRYDIDMIQSPEFNLDNDLV